MGLTRVGDLDIPHTPSWHRRWRRFHIAASIVGVLLLVAAVLGLFGEGPLAHATKSSSGGGLKVEYDRFVRTAASTFLNIQVQRSQAPIRLEISSDYLDKMSVGQISPQPDSEQQTSDHLILTFNQKPPAQIQVYVVPQKIGVRGGTFTVGGERVRIQQFVYP